MPGFVSVHVKETRFPLFSDYVYLCYNERTNRAWLELTNTEYLVNGCEGPSRVVKVFIGAVRTSNGWEAIKPGDAYGGGEYVRDSLLGMFSDTDTIFRFQQAIVNQWRGFTTARASNWAKGTTLGKSLTSASFVAKALKTGFDAIGKPLPAYSGLKLGGWSINDLKRYASRREQAWRQDAALIGFSALGPNPMYDSWTYAKDRPRTNDYRTLAYIRSNRNHCQNFAYDDQLAQLPKEFERVIAYGFRGDTRPPMEVKAAGGFNPNYTRVGHIAQHDAKKATNPQEHVKEETGALDLQRFVKDQFLGGFLSASKSIACAKEFATGYTNPPPKDGWVYACFVQGGIHLPPKGTHPWVKYAEQEIAMPGILDWDDVMGFRRVKKNGVFDGPVYLRSEFRVQDLMAFLEVWSLLSGKSQGRS